MSILDTLNNKFPDLSAACKKAHKDYELEITGWNEFMTELAYINIKWGLGEMGYKKLPEAPLIYNKYQILSKEEKRKFLEQNPNVLRDTTTEIGKYIQKKERVECRNRSNLYWLKEWKKYIPTGDLLSHEKIDQKIGTYSEMSVFFKKGDN